MASFLQTLKSRLINCDDNNSTFTTARTIDSLFPRTRASIDGDSCLHDCDSCTIKYPRKFSIDEEDKLYGQIKGWTRHVIVATGKTDWVRDVEDEPDSVMQAIGAHRKAVQGGRLMLSASNIPVEGEGEKTRILLLPAFKWIEGVDPATVPQVIDSIINIAPANTSPINAEGSLLPTSLPDGVSLTPCQHKYLILLCSQKTRDARCGQSAPLLRQELERHLYPLGLHRDLNDERPGGVGIYFISHVGGHKYSANMLIYRRGEVRRTVEEQTEPATDGHTGGKPSAVQDAEASQCIWLARVRPEDCENIVKFTLLQGKVVKPDRQLRGGFDRERGVLSW
ncbi:hypothetical protein K470DRAFT_260606 [Piedraia hortae CBS 480.64]|uniref:Sucrase/ferredoxin domain-containing protein n=1 Tax=Piedraia hortae CBS 480.64 TaxID=1314780 RepID=A0A6A7BQZ5_9PEZI|nr:hypothetical protein K470DRAFT_260606 [Piedraia hortae CBS 480.64]